MLCISIISYSQRTFKGDTLEFRLEATYSRFQIVAEKVDQFYPPNYACDMAGGTVYVGKYIKNNYLYTGFSARIKFPRSPYVIQEGPNTFNFTHPDVDWSMDRATSRTKYLYEIPIGFELNFKKHPIILDPNFTIRFWDYETSKFMDPFRGDIEFLLGLRIKHKITENLLFSVHYNHALDASLKTGNIKRSWSYVDSYIDQVVYRTMSAGFGLEYKFKN